jgi:hypothetical protein
MLCPLKFINITGYLKDNKTGKVQSINKDKCQCEKEKCAWWVEIRKRSGKEGNMNVLYEEGFKGCALKRLVEK